MGLTKIKDPAFLPFPGFADARLENRSHESFRFHTRSLEVLAKRIVFPLQDSERRNSMKLLCAMRDFPLHATIGEGIGQEAYPEMGEVSDCPLNEVVISFSQLVVDGATLFLAVDTIPKEVLNLRAEVNAKHTAEGLNVTPIVDLLHITLARIMFFSNREKLSDYVEDVKVIREGLWENPIKLEIVGIFRGRADINLKLRSR